MPAPDRRRRLTALDGESITPGTTTFDAVDGNASDDSTQLAYTVAVEVSAGTHEVEQVGGIMDMFGEGDLIEGNWAYNRAHLVVEWVPQGSVS